MFSIYFLSFAFYKIRNL